MKRDAFLRELKKHARKNALKLTVIKTKGKGSHYRVYLGNKAATVQGGELTPFHVSRIKKQLGIK